ncbi:MAG: EAL domain-containing protein [Planctomycetia bacterium]|nr:EAL domain-containing protein [Planctomycetia bacterium]
MSAQCSPQIGVLPASQEWVITGRPVEGQEPRSFPLTTLPFRVGRKSGLSLTLPRNTVSGLHAEFFEQNHALWIQDLSSTNGTFVNGDRLTSPRQLHDNDLVQFADTPFRLNRGESNHPSHTRSQNACDQALALVQMDRLFAGKGVIPHYQPIIDLRTNAVVAFEVLARSRLVGLETPEFMFNTAAHLGLTTALSEELRRVAIDECGRFDESPHLFLNTHPCEVQMQTLLESCETLRRMAPHQRITIEIHEAAITEVDEMTALQRGLDAINITLAFDDFGAGQARIVELAEVRPQYIKFDRSMIQNLQTADASRLRVVAGMVAMVNDLGIVPLAEGVETPEERDACVAAGFVLSQGFLHGKPMPAAHYLSPPRTI